MRRERGRSCLISATMRLLCIMNSRAKPNDFKQRRGSARPIPLNLDGHPAVTKITAFICGPNGQLDAVRIAKLYAQPLARFALALGVPVSSLLHDPANPKHTGFLRRFEQTARLLPFSRGKAAFARWANTPNTELNHTAPIELLWGSRRSARLLVELVEEILVGQPD